MRLKVTHSMEMYKNNEGLFIPTKTITEQEVFDEFEELGYKIKINNDDVLQFIVKDEDVVLEINKKFKEYKEFCYCGILLPENITLKEHQLLHKLFSIWGWFDE